MKAEIYSIKSNIIRCKLGERENEFSLVLSDINKNKKYKSTNSSIVISIDGLNFSLRRTNNEILFVQKDVDFRPIDVMKTICESTPEIEVLDTVDGQRTVIKNLIEKIDRKSYQITTELQFEKDEKIYGLGQDEDGVYNKRGTRQYLYQHNMIIPMPCIVSDKGYGILFDASCLIEFDDTKSTTKIVFDTLDSLDYYVIEGSIDDIISGFRYLTGNTSMLPKWAFGYLQSKERYKTADELIAVAKEYRKRGIPLDGVIQDWKTWEGERWGEKIVDKSRFPNIADMNNKLHAMNIHTMVSVWPNMNAGGENHEEFAKKEMLLNDYSTYNAFDKQARKVYWQQAEKELFSDGFDAWWCDSTEPFTAPDWCGYPKRSDKERFKLVGDEHKKFLDPSIANAYALMHAKGIYENQRDCTNDKRVFNLTRSGYPGIQQYGAVLWAGDTSASWNELKAEISKGLSMGLSGLPYWTVDIGAFFVGGTACWRKWKGDLAASPVWFWDGDYDDGVKDDRYKELYVRWLQFGAFLPIFRSHGTDTAREIWNFGQSGTPYYDAIKQTIELRYQLIEYIYSMAARVTLDDYTIMRSLLFDFSHDEIAKEISDEFMFGDSFLICPVLSPLNEQMERVCYLPKGCKWYNFWTGKLHKGGQYISEESQLDRIPLFVKAGSIIPIKKNIQYVNQNAKEIELHIYPGRDGKFALYFDEADGYGYEKGNYSLIDLTWDDSKRILYICGQNALLKQTMKLKIIFQDEEREVAFLNENTLIRF